MSKIPFDRINAAALAAYPGLLHNWFPAGQIRGHEFVLGDLRGSRGESLSINVRTGKWADFSTDQKGGDPISLHAAAHYAGDRIAAARDLGNRLGINVNDVAAPHIRAATAPREPGPADTLTALPAPEQNPPPARFRHLKHGEPSRIWLYRDAAGALICVVARYDTATGKKFSPWCYGRRVWTDRDGKPQDRTGWHAKAPPAPRPLYGLDRLAARPDAPVLVTEGEKAADAAGLLFPDHVAIAALNGASGSSKSDWTPLQRRAVTIWPDNDVPGAGYARAVSDLVPGARIVAVPTEWPDGWDLADAAPDGADIAAMLAAAVARPVQPEPDAADQGGDPGADWIDNVPAHDDPPASGETAPTEGIVPLGYDRGIFYYFSRAAKQVFELKPGEHSRNSLMAMASVAHYWQRTEFKNQKSGNIDWEAATDWLMCECRAVGIFDPNRLRGRGVWIDAGRSVLHAGDHLIVDGKKSSLMLSGSRFVYEAAHNLVGEIRSPLNTTEAHRLVKLCNKLRWERGISGTLLAGWIAIASISGGLAWRPSIWITGPSGAGKTWVYENVICSGIGKFALQVQSKTSEAGIRQRLHSDARPVLIDEAERETPEAAKRLQGILDLIRQSASETGGEILKGTQDQKEAKGYRIRSSFCLSSINVGLMHAADESRITVLSLRAPDPANAEADARAFHAIQAEASDLLTPEFSAELLARAVRLLPIIRGNAETFAQAVALHLGSRRLGDQLGALLAGAYSLHSERKITTAEATAYVRGQNWEIATAERNADPDEFRLIAHLTQHRVRVTLGGSALECTIGRLISAAIGRDTIDSDKAELELRARGIRSDAGGGIVVSNTHPELARILAETPWSAGWGRTLSRLPGAESTGKTVRFNDHHLARAVFVPAAAMGA